MLLKIAEMFESHYASGILKTPRPLPTQVHNGDEIGMDPNGRFPAVLTLGQAIRSKNERFLLYQVRRRHFGRPYSISPEVMVQWCAHRVWCTRVVARTTSRQRSWQIFQATGICTAMPQDIWTEMGQVIIVTISLSTVVLVMGSHSTYSWTAMIRTLTQMHSNTLWIIMYLFSFSSLTTPLMTSLMNSLFKSCYNRVIGRYRRFIGHLMVLDRLLFNAVIRHAWRLFIGHKKKRKLH